MRPVPCSKERGSRGRSGSQAHLDGRSQMQGDPAQYDGPLAQDHGYLNKRLVRRAFPHLFRGGQEWTARLRREMSYAAGPTDMSHLGFHVPGNRLDRSSPTGRPELAPSRAV